MNGRVLSEEEIQTIEQNIDGPAQVISALIATIRDRDKTIADCKRYVAQSNYDSEQTAIKNVHLEQQNTILREALERIDKQNAPLKGVVIWRDFEEGFERVKIIAREALAKITE